MTERPEAPPPLFSVVRGEPTPEELAALVAVLQTRDAGVAAPSAGSAGSPRSTWAAPAALHRRPLPLPSPTAWQRTPH
jgi:acyl-CoA carboxylase epsilon subunit